MKLFYKESKNFFTKKEKEFIYNNVVHTADFPWYRFAQATSEKFPFYGHVLIRRYNVKTEKPVINSDIYLFFYEIFKRFCKKHKIKHKQITRAIINSITYHGKYQNTDPHIDHDFNHKILMMYLNNTSGDTIIYDKKFYPGGLTILPIDETSKRPMKELKRVSPELGKVMCVDGKHFHAGSFPEPGDRRVVVVFTFI